MLSLELRYFFPTSPASLSARVCMYAVCSHLGFLTELIVDDNDLSCQEKALAPLCKLRNLRTLSLEKNKLAKVPPLIGTMLTLRRVRLYSNQLVELPASLCLLTLLEVRTTPTTGLRYICPVDSPFALLTLSTAHAPIRTRGQVLDVHKNMIASLPTAVGKLASLQKLDVSENKLSELPTTICELNEDLQVRA